VSCNITIFYPDRGIAYFKCIEINKASLSKLRVSFEYLFAGPSVLVFGNQNMVILPTMLCQKKKKKKHPTMLFLSYWTL